MVHYTYCISVGYAMGNQELLVEAEMKTCDHSFKKIPRCILMSLFLCSYSEDVFNTDEGKTSKGHGGKSGFLEG